MSLWVEVDELHAAGTQIAQAVAAPGALVGAAVLPAASDQVSVGVATALTARFGVLATYSAHGAHVAGTAASVLHANASTYQQQEDLNTAALRPDSGTPPPTAAPPPSMAALPSPPAATMPVTPPLPPVGVTPTDGKTVAALIHGGPGPQPLLDAAHQARTHATELQNISTDLRTATTRLDQGWQSPAADAAVGRITALSGWYEDHAQHAATAARACETQAEAFAHTRATVPRPEVFEDLERRLLAATRANAATGGLYTPVVTQLHTQLAVTHTKALAAYADYTTRAADLPTDTPTPPPHTPGAAGQPAPPVAGGTTADDRIVGPRTGGPHIQMVDDKTGPPPPAPNPQPKIGPFPVPPQVAAAAPPGPPRPIDPTGGLLTPQDLPPALPPPSIPGVTSMPPGAAAAGGAPGKVFTWAPSGSDVATAAGGAVAGGTTDGVTQATLNAIAASPGTGPGAADPGLLKWLEDVKGVSRVGGVVGAVTAIPAVMSDIGAGNSVPEAVTRESASTVAALGVGALADAGTGAAIGSIFPGAGTAVGAVVGAVFGVGAGAAAAFGVSKIVEGLWE
jgi:PPE family protein/PE family protein